MWERLPKLRGKGERVPIFRGNRARFPKSRRIGEPHFRERVPIVGGNGETHEAVTDKAKRREFKPRTHHKTP